MYLIGSQGDDVGDATTILDGGHLETCDLSCIIIPARFWFEEVTENLGEDPKN